MNTMKYINYNRKSSDSEDKQMLSIISQEEAAQDMAARDNLNIVDVINESKSAKIPKKRNGFKNLLSKIKSGQANAIICWKLDRLARNMVEGGEIIELLQLGKIQEIRTPFKTYIPNENAILLAVEFGSANQYSRDLSNNVKRGLEKKAKLGVPNGLAPFGFMNTQSGDKGTRKWVVDPDRFEIVKRIFQKVLEGKGSIRSVYFWADEQFQITTPKRKRLGGKKISISYYYSMLKNPIYAGYFIQAGERYDLDPKLPRVITEQEHKNIRRMIDVGSFPSRAQHQAYYAGLITSPSGEFIGPDYKFQLICDCKHKFAYLNRTSCPKCNISIQDMCNPKFLTYSYYYNSSRKKKRLPVKMLSESVINSTIKEFVSSFYMPPALLRYVKDIMQELIQIDESNNHFVEQRKEERLVALQNKKRAFREILADGIITKEEYQTDVESLNEEIEYIKNSVTTGSGNPFQQAIKSVLTIHDVFSRGDAKQKRVLLEKIGSNLIWDEKKLYFSCPDWLNDLKNSFKQAKYESGWFEHENTLDNPGLITDFSKGYSTLSASLNRVRTYFDGL